MLAGWSWLSPALLPLPVLVRCLRAEDALSNNAQPRRIRYSLQSSRGAFVLFLQRKPYAEKHSSRHETFLQLASFCGWPFLKTNEAAPELSRWRTNPVGSSRRVGSLLVSTKPANWDGNGALGRLIVLSERGEGHAAQTVKL